MVVGTTGTGKTNTLLHFVNNAFVKNNKIIFVDGKADEGLITDLANFSKSKNKKMILFTIGKNKYANKSLYDPFGGKSESEIISILSEMEGFSDSMDSNSDSSFYKKMEKGVFDFIIPLMKKTRVKIDFDSLYEWVQPNFLKNKFEKNSFWNDLFPGLEKTNKTLFIEKVENIKNDFKKIQAKTWETMQSKYLSYKNAFSGIVKANTTTLKQILEKNNDIACLLISLNPMANLTFTKILANLITYDLKANADFNQTQGTTELIFDEIGSYASNSIVELLTQGRSKLYRVFIGVQGISQLKQVGEHFSDIVLNNTNTKIVHRFNEKTLEDIARFFGTETDTEITHRVDGVGENLIFSGTGSFKVVDRFVINPNVIRNLKVGQAIVSTLINDEPFVYKKPIFVELIKTIDNLIFDSPKINLNNEEGLKANDQDINEFKDKENINIKLNSYFDDLKILKLPPPKNNDIEIDYF